MTDIDILKRAMDYENDPRRNRCGFKSWEHHAVGATKADVKRLKDQGYIQLAAHDYSLVKYQLTNKGKEVIWAQSMEDQYQAPSRSEVLDALELVVGFEDIKETLADALASRRRINLLLEGPPACAKSVMLDGVRKAVPSAYMAFGSRTSAAGLSDVLFEMRPAVLLLDEAEKMRHDVYSVMLGLMENGEILETKVGKTRGAGLNTTVIAACNSSRKLSPEFLSRFAFHPRFPKYSRDDFIDVVVGMLTRAEGCPLEIAQLIGGQVYEHQLGDVRKARGVWQLMREPTVEEVDRIILMSLKYSSKNIGNNISVKKKAGQYSLL